MRRWLRKQSSSERNEKTRPAKQAGREMERACRRRAAPETTEEQRDAGYGCNPAASGMKKPGLQSRPGVKWSERRDSNPRHSPWQGEALPLSYARTKLIPSTCIGSPSKRENGGEGGIRTPGTRQRTHAFQACSLNHSDTSPAAERVGKATHSPIGNQPAFSGFSQSMAQLKRALSARWTGWGTNWEMSPPREATVRTLLELT